MTTEIKTCVSCDHCCRGVLPICNKFSYETIDYVTGVKKTYDPLCSSVRLDLTKCGPDAKFWEPRQKRKVPDWLYTLLYTFLGISLNK